MFDLQCSEVVGLDNFPSATLVSWRGITSLSRCHPRKSLPPAPLRHGPADPRKRRGGSRHSPDTLSHRHRPAPNCARGRGQCPSEPPSRNFPLHTPQLCPRTGKMKLGFLQLESISVVGMLSDIRKRASLGTEAPTLTAPLCFHCR